MIVDVVSGWSENVGDQSALWSIADDVAFLTGADGSQPLVRRHTCGSDLRPFLAEKTKDESQKTKRLWIVYSYGCADLWKNLADMRSQPGAAVPQAAVPQFDHLVIIAGVPRLWDGQFEVTDANGVWHVDPAIWRAATCFQPRGIVIPQSQFIKNESAIPPFGNVYVPDVDHSSIVPAVHDDVVAIARELLAEETGGGG
jgi:hypothetical protein